MILDIEWGTSAEASAVFRNALGIAFDPPVVNVLIQSPDLVETTYVYLTDADVVKDSTGHYHFNIVEPDQSGRWLVRFKGIGALRIAKEVQFNVLPSKFKAP